MTRLSGGAATDVGRVRSTNQDSFFVSSALYAVADGMGGHRAGEVAAELATESLRREFGDGHPDLTTDELVRAVQRANTAVVSAAADDPDLSGMGTTLCALALIETATDERLAIINVGDSRVYLLKEGDLEQITDDHSLVATLERQGRLTADEAAVHPQRNIITRALGIDTRVMVDSWEVRPVPGDRYLLCSDGLFNEVEESRIAATMRKLASPDEAARELVRLANEGGGRDNITVVVVDVEGEADPSDGVGEAEAAAGLAGGAAGDDRVIRRRVGRDEGHRRPGRAAAPATDPARAARRPTSGREGRDRTTGAPLHLAGPGLRGGRGRHHRPHRGRHHLLRPRHLLRRLQRQHGGHLSGPTRRRPVDQARAGGIDRHPPIHACPTPSWTRSATASSSPPWPTPTST